MTVRWRDLDDAGRDAVADLFAALDRMAALNTATQRSGRMAAGGSAATSPSQLWSALTAGAPLPPGFEGWRDGDLLSVLERFAVAGFPRQAAAATDGASFNARQGRGVRATLSPSRADAGQSYVTLEFTDSATLPKRILVLRPDGAVIDRALPAAVDATIQLLLGGEDPILAALRDPDCRLYLV